MAKKTEPETALEDEIDSLPVPRNGAILKNLTPEHYDIVKRAVAKYKSMHQYQRPSVAEMSRFLSDKIGLNVRRGSFADWLERDEW